MLGWVWEWNDSVFIYADGFEIYGGIITIYKILFCKTTLFVFVYQSELYFLGWRAKYCENNCYQNSLRAITKIGINLIEARKYMKIGS